MKYIFVIVLYALALSASCHAITVKFEQNEIKQCLAKAGFNHLAILFVFPNEYVDTPTEASAIAGCLQSSLNMYVNTYPYQSEAMKKLTPYIYEVVFQEWPGALEELKTLGIYQPPH